MKSFNGTFHDKCLPVEYLHPLGSRALLPDRAQSLASVLDAAEAQRQAHSLHGRISDAWKHVPGWAQRGTGNLF